MLASVVVCAAAVAGPAPSGGTQAPGGTQPGGTQPGGTPPPASQEPPDDELIEFLGTDDVGDSAWWEFLKKAPPRGGNPSPPSQETKQ
jgi:hypothetical protein